MNEQAQNNERDQWIEIITKLYSNLHMSASVMYTAIESDKKRDRILKYFERLERVHNKVAQSKNKNDEKLLKNLYHKLYVIKPENIPDSYFEHEKQIMRERGYGDIEITPERKEILVNQIISDQEESLDKWIDYFLYDEESKNYEMWEKYWVFQGLQKLGKYDKEKREFSKRNKHTVYPFPPVDREAIFTTLKLMEEYIKDQKGEEEIKSALSSGNFKTLYEYSLKQIMNKGEKQSTTIDGEWIKYDQGSDYNKLRDSLQGYYTGWCTAAGENFAKGQLANGDFYVYYSYDENNEPKVPRIAIRMNGHNEIGEIRGIASNQNMEPEMVPILNKKLKTFPDKDKYLKKEYDMQLLTIIDNKVKQRYELTLEELRFLYEIDSQIEGFGYRKDPRIEKIKSKRNIKQDLVKIFNCNEDEISIGKITEENFEQTNGKKIHYGDFKLFSLMNAESLTFPQHVGGDLNLENLTSAKSLTLPESIGGDLILMSLTSADGLTLPKSIGGNLVLMSLTSADNLMFPENIGGDLNLSGLFSTEGATFPQNIGGNLKLWNLTKADGLTFPKIIGGDLNLENLTSAKNLTLPQSIGGNLNLLDLTSAENLTLPESVGGDLVLMSLTSAKALTFPQSIGGNLHLNSLTSAEGLILPQIIGGCLWLRGLTTAKGLKLPKEFDLSKLIVSNEVMKEIEANPNLYYQNEKLEEKLEMASSKLLR